MIKTYRWKLVTAFLIVITTLLILLGSITLINFKSYYLNNLEERLTKEALLVADMAKYRWGDQETKRSYQDICNVAAQDSAARITIIRADGVVVGDSSAQTDKMDLHNGRPEVYAALHGNIGIEIRYSDTLKMNMLYVAVPFHNEEIEGAVRIAMPLQELQSIYNHMLLIMFMVVLGCGIVAFLLSILLAQYFSKPIQEITAAVKEMAGGNLKRRSSYHSGDEIGVLSEAFNEMGEHIENSMREVSTVKNRLEVLLNNTINGILMIGGDGKVTFANPAAVSLLGLSDNYVGRKYMETISAYELLDMIDVSRKTMQIIKSNIVSYTIGTRTIEVNVVPIKSGQEISQDLLVVLNDITETKRLEKMRKDFVANVSHELKTPVASISGFAETLLDEADKNPENVSEFASIIYDEAGRLSRLINALLELSKWESDEARLNIKSVNVSELVGETVDRIRNRASMRSIQVSYDQPKVFPEIKSDPELICQILMNLLDNAIKYSSDGGQIEVKLEEIVDRVKISVKDNGIGIPEKELPRIFERFYRVDKDRSRKTGGTGLGLAIVKHLVENLHGQVTVESTIGQGSVFTINLPL